MHQLVPNFILDACAAGRYAGSFTGVGLFVDISGFSPMSDALMAHGQHGAEVLAEIMRAVFDPLLEAIFAQGGFTASSAGDAITALFPEPGGEIGPEAGGAAARALAAARQIQEQMHARSSFATEYETFNVSAKVGLAPGEVRWGILFSPDGARGAYYFQGAGVEDSAAAEHHAGAGEIILNDGLLARLNGLVEVDALEGAEGYHRLRRVTGELPAGARCTPALPDVDLMARFYPRVLVTQALNGEFRQAVSMFISLPSVRTDTQLRIFMESVFALQEKYAGLLGRLDFGDKGTNLLLFWGAPAAYENDIARALNFILDLQQATSIPISAGITYRISHAGYIGGRLHEEYTCFGRGVSLAARMMTGAQRGEIWVDGFVARRAEAHFDFEALGEMRFKGFRQPQKVFALLDRKAASQAVFSGVMEGREKDLRSMLGFVEPALEGVYAGLLLISGEPGIGKSRLLHELVDRLAKDHPDEFQVFVAQTDEILRQPFNPFIYWLRQYLGISAGLGDLRAKRSFNRVLDTLIVATADRALADELDRTRSFLGALVDLTWPDSLYEQLDAQGRYQNTILALAALLKAEAQRKPVIFLLEDIHWLDGDSAEFLAGMLRQQAAQAEARAPLAILATSRFGLKDHRLEESTCQELRLQGLSRASMAALAGDFLSGAPSESLVALLEARAEGNPFYAGQILAYLKEEDLLEFSAGVWSLKPGQLEALPADVSSLLVARLDHLAQKVKEAVQTAAVLGREFEVNLLAYMLGRAEGETPPEISAGEREAIWSALSHMRYIFNHTLLRDAAYQMQVHARRRDMHALALQAYETLYAADLDDHAVELAYHAQQAGIPAKARRYLKIASDAASKAFLNAQAVEYLTRALALTPPGEQEARFDLLMDRAAIYQRLASRPSLERDLSEAGALLPALNDPRRTVEVLLRRAEFEINGGNFDQSIGNAGDAAVQAESAGLPAQTSRAYYLLATSLFRQGKYDVAVEYAQRSLDQARSAQAPDEEMRSWNILGLIFLDQNKTGAAREAFQFSLQIARSTGSLRYEAGSLNNLSQVTHMEGDYTASLLFLEQSLAISLKMGDRLGETSVTGNQAFMHMMLGDYRKARGLMERYLQLAREIGNPILEDNALINLSACDCWLGDFDSAEENARQAVGLAQRMKDRSGEAWGYTNLGHSLLGKLSAPDGSAAPTPDLEAGAEQAYRAALSIRGELQQPVLAAEPAAGLAQVALRRGDLAEARRILQPVIDHLAGGGNLEGCDDPLRVYLTCYLVLKPSGDPRAASMLAAARQMLSSRVGQIPDEETRRAFLNIDHHRQILAA